MSNLVNYLRVIDAFPDLRPTKDGKYLVHFDARFDIDLQWESVAWALIARCVAYLSFDSQSRGTFDLIH